MGKWIDSEHNQDVWGLNKNEEKNKWRQHYIIGEKNK